MITKIKFKIFLLLCLSGGAINGIDFPVQPAQPMLDKYLNDNELINCIEIDAHEIHWRDKYRKIGIRYFLPEELENLKISVNDQGLLTYKGVHLAKGSYAYILSNEGELFAFARKDVKEKELNKELVRSFQKNPPLPSKKGPLFKKIVFKHSSLSLGKELLAVGDFEIDAEGRAVFFSNDSGHYRLSALYMKNLAVYLRSAGIQDAVFHLYYKDWLNRVVNKVVKLSDILEPTVPKQ
ncbi:MAG: hypothetical protein LVR00_06295 [Rhabdochlamydiaceae bacterium]|jgi:hypothetical protein